MTFLDMFSLAQKWTLPFLIPNGNSHVDYLCMDSRLKHNHDHQKSKFFRECTRVVEFSRRLRLLQVLRRRLGNTWCKRDTW